MEIDIVNTDKKAIIDDEDYNKISIYSWSINKKNGHVKAYIGNNTWSYLSRIIMNVTDPVIQVDHKNFDKLDNRKQNLRICTNAENSRNNKKRQKGKYTSKYKGVSWEPRVKKWRSTITFNYKQKHIGTFNSEIEAAQAYNKTAMELFGDFCKLNEV